MGVQLFLACTCQMELNQCGLGGYRARVIKDVFVSQAASRQGGDIAPAQLRLGVGVRGSQNKLL